MRGECEMLDLIVGTAEEDARIRAVILNGSRASPDAPRDCFQDFDVVYLVTDVAPFRRDLEWIRRFGRLMILQLPDDMSDPPSRGDDGYAYLMQFTDGNRIDLTIQPVARHREVTRDSLTIVLLDKDGILGAVPPPHEGDYLPRRPTPKAFADCCNEFWWVCPYVAKGLWRGELPYARHMLDQVVRDQLMKMLEWYVGVRTGFTVSAGKYGKYLPQRLEPELWVVLRATYADADHTWEALEAMCTLFRTTATRVAEACGLEYPDGDDARVSAHLRHVRKLPAGAREVY
jgi:aminoglycoside 6-adenylyltransferase